MFQSSESLESRERRLDEAAAKYFELEAAGTPVDRQRFLAQHGDLASELAEFLNDLDQLKLAAEPEDQANSPDSSTLIPEVEGAQVATNTSVRNLLGSRTPSTRYRLNHFLARGGMGEVWSAEDSHVGRQIAVKRILNAANAGTIAEQRFLFESQIMGQLEHPCIVPLHDLGRDESGKLFAVMKLVNGCSLKERLGSFHATKSGADWPRQVEFLRLLEAFVSICRAVAYAHSRGVLHRDIKPDNIMLGNYGEALLLDWGLAKTLNHIEPSVGTKSQSEKVHLTPGVSTATRAGAIMGSPSYMSPEIAMGHADVADERTDIYLLGATLYEVLTGRPPRSGSSQREIITLAQSSPPSPPRQVDPHIPKALEAVCRKAMAHDTEQRYASATALAKEIECYLASEPVTAYREAAMVRIWRWCRHQRRTIQRMLISVTLATLCGLIWYSYRRTVELESQAAARIQLVEFRRLADETHFFAANTDTISERAPYFDPQHAIQVGTAALESASRWGDQALLFPVAEERSALTSEFYELLLLLANLQQHSATTTDRQTDALALLDRAAKLRPASRAYYQIRSRCLRQLGQTVAAEDDLEMAPSESQWTAQDWFLEGEQERLVSSTASGPASVLSTDQQDSSAVRRAIAAYGQALRLNPEHYWAQFQLARCYLRTQRASEAVALLGTCIALRPESPWAYSTRGLVRGLLGQFVEADADFAQALRLAPQFRPARLNRGYVYLLQNNDAAALTELDTVLQPPQESVLIEAAFYRAQVHYQRGDLIDALRDCDRFLEERPDFAPVHSLAAQIHFRQKEESKGIQCVDAMLSCSGRSEFDPTSPAGRIARARALRELAVSLDLASQQRVLRLALRELESAGSQDVDSEVIAIKDLLGLAGEAIDSYTNRLATAPRDIETRKKRGWNYVAMKRYELAAADFATAIEHTPEDAEAHAGLGYVLALQGDRGAAEVEATRAVLLGGNGFLVLHNVACIYAELAHANTQQRTEYEDLAITFLEHAVVLSRLNPSGIDEVECIRAESAFHESLKTRPEFLRLLKVVKNQ